MSELSDYKRLVEAPQIASYEATIRSLREEVSQLHTRLATVTAERDEYRADYLAEARVTQFVAEAIGAPRFMDPPDGGSATLPEQVMRMRQALEAAEAKLAEAREVVEPFARAATAIGNEPGPLRFYTDRGYREIPREALDRARSFLSSIAEKTTPATDREDAFLSGGQSR